MESQAQDQQVWTWTRPGQVQDQGQAQAVQGKEEAVQAQAPVKAKEHMVFGLKFQLKRGIRFHDNWCHELEAALHPEAKGQVLSDKGYRVHGDFASIGKALEKTTQKPTVVLISESTRKDCSFVTMFYDDCAETDSHDIILEVVDVLIPLGQKMVTLWEPILEKSPMPGIFAPTPSESSDT